MEPKQKFYKLPFLIVSMYLNENEFNEILKELEEVLKTKALAKISSLIYSLYRTNEDLRKSRDKWREKCNLMSGKIK